MSDVRHKMHVTCSVNDCRLRCLTIKINHTVDTRWKVTCCQTLVNAVHKEMQSAIIVSHYTDSVTRLQHTSTRDELKCSSF